ncbi:hypothetical protein BUALT_Bualt02G0124200 [Buddleja alternifolia]|uniref:GTP diphosphokinase n=1 Tax=Buddleja alternifolia TaxID=168488 RepID=A0AAV6Y5W3_9LAMI|nr:hypothetical protein BUALT_Bualt02G0124200 [Buddleja alternifolia]
MSASTVSITANQGPTTRRRAVEKNIATGGSDSANAAVSAGENNDAKLTAGDTAAGILRDARKTPSQSQAKKSGPSRKSTKPIWVTVISILIKNLALLVVFLGFVQMIRLVLLKSGRNVEDFSVISGDFEGKFFEVEKFVKTTMKAMQVQVNAIDRKLEDGMSSVRKEFDEKMEKNGDEMDLKLKAFDVRSDVFEKFMDEFRKKNLLSKEEFGEFFEEFKKGRRNGGSDGGDVSVDEIRDFAREIVEKEIERHAADGLGMVDYALASGGGRVLSHSEPYGVGKMGGAVSWWANRNMVSVKAEKIISPSFGEPGQCFPLKGASGFIEIRLRTAIIPDAVTLEHVAKSVAYDRSSAPKHCRVSGWMQRQGSTDTEVGTGKMFVLTEFTYDLEKSNAQTFKVASVASGPVDTIRLDFASNHGSASHTCIYRLRMRASGYPYLQHCVETAVLLAHIGANSTVVAAGLLHDTVDYSFVTYDHISKSFGVGVPDLVEGLQGRTDTTNKTDEADRLHTMLLAMADARSVLIKLADRMHNMMALDALPLFKQQRKKLNMDEIHHILGLRLIVETEEDCYKALRVVQQLWHEVSGRFKDYIVHPKFNGYDISESKGHFNGYKEGDCKLSSFVLKTVEWTCWVLTWHCETMSTDGSSIGFLDSTKLPCTFPTHSKDCKFSCKPQCGSDELVFVIIIKNNKMSVQEFPANSTMNDLLEKAGRGSSRRTSYGFPAKGGAKATAKP